MYDCGGSRLSTKKMLDFVFSLWSMTVCLWGFRLFISCLRQWMVGNPSYNYKYVKLHWRTSLESLRPTSRMICAGQMEEVEKCQTDLHLQSWWMLMKLHLNSTCKGESTITTTTTMTPPIPATETSKHSHICELHTKLTSWSHVPYSNLPI